MINEKYSLRDFTNKRMVDEGVTADEINGTIIVGTCFFIESEYWIVNSFPEGMTGVTFDRCNLDNIMVPEGNTILPNCCNRKIPVGGVTE